MTSFNMVADLSKILGDSQQLVQKGYGVEAITALCLGLSRLGQSLSAAEFDNQVVPLCRSHPLFAMVQQDPYSRRAYDKPRGYAGDAVMLDYIYDGTVPTETSEVGKTILAGTTRTSNGLSVLDRRQRVADLVDRICQNVNRPRIASLAAGHLREADLAQCLKGGADRLGQWLAIDQDADSLQRIHQHWDRPEITTIRGSVTDLIRGKWTLGQLDGFYSAGLLDYLSDRLAKRTVATMFSHLKSNGELLVCNFTPHSQGRYFMQAFMDWNLVYRDAHEMMQLVDEIPGNEIAHASTYTDDSQNIVYLHLSRS